MDEAVAPLERNTKLQPMSPYGWYQLARVQFDRGKPDKTRAILDHLATFEPKVAAQLARETGLPAAATALTSGTPDRLAAGQRRTAAAPNGLVAPEESCLYSAQFAALAPSGAAARVGRRQERPAVGFVGMRHLPSFH